MKKVYIILPTYNDWKSLNKVLKILNYSLKGQKKEIYIIVVNDGSSSKYEKTKKYWNFKKVIILNLKKNVGSQKAIFFGLKYLQKKIKKKNNETIISILDSDGEDNPNMVKKLIRLVNLKKDYFIFASRKKRTENNFLKALNQLRLLITFILTGKYINFGNFSSFPSFVLNKILSNNNLYLAYSSGVLKNYNKFFFVKIKKSKRFYGNSKVNLEFLILHTINIISVFYKTVFFRTFFFLMVTLFFLENVKLKTSIISFFLLINLVLAGINICFKPKKVNLSMIKSVN